MTMAKNGKLEIDIGVNGLSAALFREFVAEDKENATEKKKLFRRSKR